MLSPARLTLSPPPSPRLFFKIKPLFDINQTPVIHVLDASRSVTVVGALLSDRKADYVEVS